MRSAPDDRPPCYLQPPLYRTSIRMDPDAHRLCSLPHPLQPPPLSLLHCLLPHALQSLRAALFLPLTPPVLWSLMLRAPCAPPCAPVALRVHLRCERPLCC